MQDDGATATASSNSASSAPAAGQADAPTLESLTAEVGGAFTQETYHDSDTGKELAFNIFLPEGYSSTGSYPLVHSDASCVSEDPTTLLSQYGALIQASSVTQASESVHRRRALLHRDGPGRPRRVHHDRLARRHRPLHPLAPDHVPRGPRSRLRHRAVHGLHDPSRAGGTAAAPPRTAQAQAA